MTQHMNTSTWNKCCICGEPGDLKHFVRTFGVIKEGPVVTCSSCRSTYPDSVEAFVPAVGVIHAAVSCGRDDHVGTGPQQSATSDHYLRLLH